MAVTQLPSCLKQWKSYLEREMRERKVKKQMQGAQKGVCGSLSPLFHILRRTECKHSSVIPQFNREAGIWSCGEEDRITGNP